MSDYEIRSAARGLLDNLLAGDELRQPAAVRLAAALEAATAKPLTPFELRAAGQIEAADKAAESLIDDAAGRIVGEDVRLCLSWLVSELFRHTGEPGSIMEEEEANALQGRPADVDDMRDQLPSGYVVERGIDPSDDCEAWRWWERSAWEAGDAAKDHAAPSAVDSVWFETELEALQDLYEAESLDAAEGCEAMEHWAVSRWLAEKLTAKGESVVETNWAGHVWARCTMGQMIRMDGVICAIARDLHSLELTGAESGL